MQSKSLELSWNPSPPDGVEDIIRAYFAQDKSIVKAQLEVVEGGRSGASTFFSRVTGIRGKTPVPLQTELVKVANDRKEVDSFENLAAETELVYGQKLARKPWTDPSTGKVVFGFPLFEAAQDAAPVYRCALGSPLEAGRTITDLLSRLNKWYAFEEAGNGAVPLPKTPQEIADLLRLVKAYSSSTAQALATVLDPVSLARHSGVLTRVHGDLHLDNILRSRDNPRAYLIDFAEARSSGSPCLDVARLESDVLYRLTPFEVGPEDLGRIEQSLWGRGSVPATLSPCASYLIGAIRSNLRFWHTPNALFWYLIGRILNALRFLGPNWVQLVPYKFEHRRRGILASLKVLAAVANECAGGALPDHILDVPSSPSTDTLTRSALWLYQDRKYPDCYKLVRGAARSAAATEPRALMLAALSGLTSGTAAEEVGLLLEKLPKRLKTPEERGLRAFVDGTLSLRQPNRTIRHEKKAMQQFTRARVEFETADSHLLLGASTDQLARVTTNLGDITQARVFFRESIASRRKAGDHVGLGVSLGGSGYLNLRTWRFDHARSELTENLQLAREAGDTGIEVRVLNWLGQVELFAEWNVVDALAYFNESLGKAGSQTTVLYDPHLDLAWAEIGKGFAYCAAHSVQHAAASEREARRALRRFTTTASELAATVAEILAGQVLVLEENVQTARIRLKSALAHLAVRSSELDYCDYTLRVCRFLSTADQPALAKELAAHALSRPIAKKDNNLHRQLHVYGGKP